MNRAYKLVWKISNSTWVVASELATGGRGAGRNSTKLTSLLGVVATALLPFGMSDALAVQYVVTDGQIHDINGGIYTGVPGGGPSKSAISASGQGTTVDANDVAAEMHESSEYANYWAVSASNGGAVNLVDSLVEATGVFAGGVQAFGQDSVSTVHGGSIITSGNGGLGVSASSGGSIQLAEVDIRTTGGVASGAVDGQASHAIKAWGDAEVNGSDLTIHTQGNSARGIYAQSHSSGNWAEISLQRSSIVTDGEKAHGVSAEGFSTIALEDFEVLTNGKGAHALYLSGQRSSASLARSKLYASNYYGIGALIDGGWMRAVETEINARSTGLKVTDQARVELTDVSITTRGDFASALDVRGDVASPLDVEGGSTVHAVGLEINALGAAHSHGIYMNGSNVLAEDGSIRTSGSESHGVNIEGWGLVGLNNFSITTNGAQSFGARIDCINCSDELWGQYGMIGGVINTSGDMSHGISMSGAESGARPTAYLTDTSVLTTGRASHGVVLGGGTELWGFGLNVNVDGANSYAMHVTQGFSLVSGGLLFSANYSALYNDGGMITLSDGVKVAGGNNVLLEVSPEPGSLNMMAEVVAVGDIVFSDAFVGSKSLTDVSLTKSSSWTGQTSAVNNLMIFGSKWDMTGDSEVSQLFLEESVVSFVPSGDGQFKTLTVMNDLSGQGRFVMNTDLAALRGDLLRVNGQIAGDHTLIIEDSGLEPSSAGQQMMVVDGNGGTGSFALYGDHVDAGAFRYTLKQRADDWFLVGPTVVEPEVPTTPEEPEVPTTPEEPEVPTTPEEPEVPTTPEEPEVPTTPETPEVPTTPITPSKPPITPVKPKPDNLSKGANAAVAAQSAAASMWGAQMNALVKRLGELRLGEDEGGIWTRAIGESLEFDGGNSSRGYDQNISGMEIGIDKAFSLDAGKIYVGGMIGSARSDTDFGEGASGKIESKFAGAYATYIDNNGFYVDTVAKYSRFDNEVDTPSNTGKQVKGSYETDGVALDVEVGKRIQLKDGWFVEPQLEITATKAEGGSYTASNGLRVDADDIDSLQSRVGGLLGRKVELQNGMQVQPYVKASYITEHGGDSSVRVNGIKLDAELPGDRMEVGFGGVLQVSENSKISLDAEFAKGDSIEQPFGVTLGYRYLW